MKLPIYLDNNSTTPVDPRVFDEMRPFFIDQFGNAASKQHSFGWIAESAVDKARQRAASLLNVEPKEIIFTSGATESNNIVIKGIAEAYLSKGNHIITSSIEHPSVLESCRSLEKRGFEITCLSVDKYGLIDLQELSDTITQKSILVSIMSSNNEIGTIQPVKEIAKICNEKNVLFHTDAAQSVGKVPFDVQRLGLDLASVSAHKMYGPKGIGALFVKKRKPKIQIHPIISGGGHEQGLRSGTLNVPSVVGFGKACELAQLEMNDEIEKTRKLRDKFLSNLIKEFRDIKLNGHQQKRLPGNLNIRFEDISSDLLFAEIKDVAFSSGSACSTSKAEPSHVLREIGLNENEIRNSIRLGIGRFNTDEEIDYVSNKFINVIKKLKSMNPFVTAH
ncbi:MAG: cysteine desulfurase [Bacteroidetes bacterium]|nr:cysteine desulfurase [Bacteroidota bacterium]MBU2585369.1 cysteine desulfurase [Bacteroidota bacterium]